MSNGTDAPRRLDSWKEIAAYLDRDVRTVMRWVQRDGLPVHRIAGRTRGTVYALSDEVDAWLSCGRVQRPHADGLPAPPSEAPAAPPAPVALSRRPWAIVAGISVILILVVIATFAAKFMSASPTIARAALVGRDLIAFDATGQDLWRYRLAADNEDLAPSTPRLIRWDASGPPQLLVMSHVMRAGGGGTGALLLFNDAGQPVWKQALEDRYRFGETSYGPNWYPNDLLTYQVDGQWRIAAAFHHHTWWPGLVTTFDRDGRPLERFVNAGWIHKLNVTTDGRYLLAAGVSNAFGGAVLAVFDAHAISGTAPADGGSLPACSDCPAGAPVAYFVLPWADLARPTDTPAVVVQVGDTGQIELHAMQRLPREGPVPALIVALTPDLEVTRRAAADSFVAVHDLLQRQGELDHPFAACPWKTPPIRKWTAAKGWEEIR